MLCPICQLPLTFIDTTLICKNGHAITNTFNDKDDGDYDNLGKGKRVHKKKNKIIIMNKRSGTDELLLLHYKIFKELLKHFQLEDETMFKYYCEIKYCLKDKGTTSNTDEIINEVMTNNKYELDSDAVEIYQKEYERINKKINEKEIIKEKKEISKKKEKEIIEKKEILKEEDSNISNTSNTNTWMSTTTLIQTSPSNFSDILSVIYLTKRYNLSLSNTIYPIDQFSTDLSSFNWDTVRMFFTEKYQALECLAQEYQSKLSNIHKRIHLLSDMSDSIIFSRRYKLIKNITNIFNRYTTNYEQLNIDYFYYVSDALDIFNIISNKYNYIQHFKKYIYLISDYITIPEMECIIFIHYYMDKYHRDRVVEIFKRVLVRYKISKNALVREIENKRNIMRYSSDYAEYAEYVEIEKYKIFEAVEKTCELISEKLKENRNIEEEKKK